MSGLKIFFSFHLLFAKNKMNNFSVIACGSILFIVLLLELVSAQVAQTQICMGDAGSSCSDNCFEGIIDSSICSKTAFASTLDCTAFADAKRKQVRAPWGYDLSCEVEDATQLPLSYSQATTLLSNITFSTPNYQGPQCTYTTSSTAQYLTRVVFILTGNIGEFDSNCYYGDRCWLIASCEIEAEFSDTPLNNGDVFDQYLVVDDATSISHSCYLILLLILLFFF